MMRLLLMLCLFPAFLVAQNDYIIANNGDRIEGNVKQVSLRSGSSQIKFKQAGKKIQTLSPLDIRAWSSNDIIYHSKKLPLGKDKAVAVFMRLISPDEAPLIVYEYENTLGENHYTQTYMERDSVLTEVEYGRFRKQMKSYFADQPDIIEVMEDGGIKKRDLLVLVEEYNDLIAEANEIPDEVVFRNEKKSPKKENKKKRLWTLEDMLLSTEEAAQKVENQLAEEVEKITDENEKSILINSNIGASFFDQKQYDVAIPYLKKADAAINKSSDPKSLAQKPRNKAMLASIYVNKQNFNNAVVYNSDALTAWKNTTNQDDLEQLHQAYINQGIILKNLEANDNNGLWYDIIDDEGWQKTLEKRQLVAIIHATTPEKSEDYNKAFLCFEKASDLLGQFPAAQQKQKRIQTELEKGKLLFEAGEYPRAQDHYEAALMLMENDDPQFVETSRILSEIYLANELYSEAIAFIDRAQNATIGETITIDRSLLDNINKIPFPFDLLNSITTKGIILYEKNKDNPTEVELKKVLAHYAIATELLHKLRNTHRNEGSSYRLSTVTHKFSQHAVIICNTLYNLTQKEEYLKEAFHYAELSKSAVLYETVHDLKSLQVSGIPKAEVVKENGLKVQIAYLKGEVFYELQQGADRDQERLEKLQENITKITAEHNALLQNFEQQYPEYYALKYQHAGISLEKLQQELGPNDVFLEYVATDTFIYTLAISKKEIKSQWSVLTEPLPLLIKKLTYGLRNNKPTLYERNGRLVYNAVVGDLAAFIEGKKLIIAPDAELHYVPFGVLPTHKTMAQGKGPEIYKEVHFLIQDHPICYNYSASMFVLSKQQIGRNNSKKLATWAPNFDSMDEIIRDRGIGESLDPLPGAQEEAQSIANLFGSQAYLAINASEAKFKTLSDQYSVLHIATHGVLNDIDPLFSSLIMCNEDDEDGILHAFELYNMRLNADLAVLSACNSGMGQLTKGEGVVSIARGFSYAGVPNIVMSKWPVSDWSTAELMNSFYQNLKAGMPKDEALQQAKIQFLATNSDQATLMAPFFWGGFVLSGNSAPIEALIGSDPNYLLFVVLGLVFLLLMGFLLKRFKR